MPSFLPGICMSSYHVQAFSKHSDIKEHLGTMSEAGKHAEIPGGHFTKDLEAHDGNVIRTIFVLIFILMAHSGHKFAPATTAKLNTKLWPDLIIHFHVKVKTIFTRFGPWTQKPFMKWVSGKERLVAVHAFPRACMSTIWCLYAAWVAVIDCFCFVSGFFFTKTIEPFGSDKHWFINWDWNTSIHQNEMWSLVNHNNRQIFSWLCCWLHRCQFSCHEQNLQIK